MDAKTTAAREHPTKTDLPNRRVSDQGLGGAVLTMQQRLDKGDKRMGNIEADLSINTAATNEVLEIVRMGKSFFKVVGWLGKGVKWTASIVAAIGSMWYVFTHGGPSK